jgi:hypothetical protein
MDRGDRPEGRLGRGGIPTAEQLQRMYDRLGETPELEILGPAQGQQRRLLLAESDEILLQTSYRNGRLVYELRLPLASTAERPHGIGSAAGRTIGLGFETPQPDPAAFRQRTDGMRGGGMEDGMGGMGRGMGGMGRGMDGMGGGMRGGMGDMPEPFQLWTRIGLATGTD